MTKYIIHADCGNVPEKLVLRDLNIAFAQADVELEAMKDVVTSELVILSIITHGSEGAVSGVITTEQGGSFAFCDFYWFASPSGKKIKSITSYVVDLNSGE